ncbi:amidohydrolase family protein [Aureimonas sp. SK2]|uniref:amidohydrolase family protein n=1 Tax=Aureimonas sp. SK2 TaxID=3015992 RepID=UPI002443A676|nr:amidohydrolase family protein [Aureimonas sp. SK2]
MSCLGALCTDGFGSRDPLALILEGGRIASMERSAAPSALLAMPALVNAHDHARPLRASSFGAAGKPLELWLAYLSLLPPIDPYLAAAASLGRSALGGAATVMVHHTRFRSFASVSEEAAATARAARDIGVRIGVAVALRDRNPLVYGPSDPILAALPPGPRAEIAGRVSTPAPDVPTQIRLVDEVDAALGEGIRAQYGPTGPQWCSDELLIAVAEASALTGRRVHMHLLESRYQREWADHQEKSGGLVRWLADIGLLSPRLTLAHCTYARPDELELIAMSGATIAVNTSSNLQIRSGIAPVAAMVRAGCRVALGLDGLGLDEDDDALREMRLAHLLHRGWGFEETLGDAEILAMAVRNGRPAVLGEEGGGRLAEGEPADLLLLDMDRLDEDRLPIAPEPGGLLLARGTRHHIAEVIVGGRSIALNGRLTGIDHGAVTRELLAAVRHGMGSSRDLAAALPHLEAAMARHFHPPGCC